MNQTIAEAARAMLEEKHMPKAYWAEGVKMVMYLLNWTLASVAQVSLHKQYFGRKPNLTHLWVFGNITYVYVLDEMRKKLDPKTKNCILIGQSHKQKGYKCYNPRTKEV
mgnify:CR=1 FL=1